MRRRAARNITFVVIAFAGFAIRCTPMFTEVTPNDDAGADASASTKDATSDATSSFDAALDAMSRPDAPTLTSAYANAVLASMPSVYYRLGDTGPSAIDLVGADPGTYGAGTTQATPGLIAADPDRSVTFPNPPTNAADASAVVAAPRSAALEPANGLTIECWINATMLAPQQFLVSYGDNPAPSWALEIRNNSLDFVANPGMDVRSSGTIATGKTSYVAITFDAAAEVVSFYLNGVLNDQQVYSAGNLQYGSAEGLGIGGSANGDSTFNGVIDEVAIYGRALKATEIATHYNVGSGN